MVNPLPTDEAQLVASVFAEVFAPPSAQTVDAWADEHRVVVGSDEPGPWRTARVPHLRGPMRAWTDPGVDAVVLRFAAQMGKTELLFNCLMFDADTDPKWWMLVYPGFEDCKRVNKKRLIPSIRATPRVGRLLSGDRDEATVTEISLGSTEVFFAWTGSDARLKSLPVQRLAMDEIDEFAPGALELVKDRIKAAARPRRLVASTPSDRGVGIDAEYQASDQRRYERPCPFCGVYREWTWGDVAWGVTVHGQEKRGSECTPDEAEASAHLVCPPGRGGCGARIQDHWRHAMNARGVWLREGERVERLAPEPDWSAAPELSGEHLGCPIPGTVRVAGEPALAGRVAGFRASSLVSPFAGSGVGRMVRAFAESGYAVTREFVRGWLGEAWEHRGEKLEVDQLAARCTPVSAGGYRFGTVPAWASVLLGAIDVQHDRVHAVVRAFSPAARRTALVWFATMPAPEPERLAQVDPLLARTFEREGGGVARVLMWAIDSGHRTDQVYSLAARHRAPYDMLQVVKGQAQSLRGDPWWIASGQTTKGRTLPVPLMHVNVSYFKDELLAEMQRADGDAHAFCLPASCPREYIDQVTAEQRVTITRTMHAGARASRYERPGTGTAWVLRPGHRDNHALDCEVYIRALAHRYHARTCTANLLGTGAPVAPLPAAATTTTDPVTNTTTAPTAPTAPTAATAATAAAPAAPARPFRRPGGWMRRPRR